MEHAAGATTHKDHEISGADWASDNFFCFFVDVGDRLAADQALDFVGNCIGQHDLVVFAALTIHWIVPRLVFFVIHRNDLWPKVHTPR